MKYFLKRKITHILFISIGLLSLINVAHASQVMTPTIININNNAQINIALSSEDINRIFVQNQKITSINAPSGLLSGHNDSSGSIYANIHGDTPFTAFISTNLGLHFSLLIMPKSEPGQTIEFISNQIQPKNNVIVKKTVIVNHSMPAQTYEQSESYEKTVVDLIKEVMQQKTPPGYTNISPKAFSQIGILTVSSDVAQNSGLTQSVKAGFLGGQLAVRVLKVVNNTSKPVQLIANAFYSPGIRAVAISQEYVPAGGKTYVFEVVSND